MFRYQIFCTFVGALAILTSSLKTLGLSDVGLGALLVGLNFAMVGLALAACVDRQRAEAQRRGLGRRDLAPAEAALIRGALPDFAADRDTATLADGQDTVTLAVGGGAGDAGTDPEAKVDPAALLKRLQLDAHEIVMDKRIGAGAFGEVFKGAQLN